GRYPIGTIGLGTISEYSRMRVPRPPQKSTTFIIVFLVLRFVSDLVGAPLRIPKWAARAQTSQSHIEGSFRSRQSQKLLAVIRAQKPGDSRMGVAQRCRLNDPYGDPLAQTKFNLLRARGGIVEQFQVKPHEMVARIVGFAAPSPRDRMPA